MNSLNESVPVLTLSALRQVNIARDDEWCPSDKPDLSFRGLELGGEVGEALNVIKKLERERHGWRGSRDTKEHLGEELADVVISADLAAMTAGIDLEAAVIRKFNATSEKNSLSTRLPEIAEVQTKNIVNDAMFFAAGAHGAIGQKRKYTGQPYIAHPSSVANIVELVPGSTVEMIAAAWLHDVVEDTKVTIDVIRDTFGMEVSSLVNWLTDASTPADGDRESRKRLDRERLKGAPPEAQTIKVADMIDNTYSIFEHDPDFARTYIREKELLLDVLTLADPRVVWLARNIIDTYRHQVGMMTPLTA